jgi:curved DNA-binding protein
MARDYYEILGVSKTATKDEIKRAHRKLVKKYHPDHNPGDQEAERKFKEAQEAYDALSDEEKRKAYDQFGHVAAGNWKTSPQGEKVYQWHGGGSEVRAEDLEEILSAFGMGGMGRQSQKSRNPFDTIFSRGRQSNRQKRSQPAKGRNIEKEVNLTFEQAMNGTTVDLNVITPAGRRQSSQTLTVKIPPGVADGQKIRIPGRGMTGNSGGPPGDIYIFCKVAPHPEFKREGDNILVHVPISLTDAALGTKVDVPTINGTVTLTIAPGTPSHAKLRIKNHGAPKPDGTRGDQFAVIKIIPPKNLTDEQKEILEKLANSLNTEPA